MPAVVPAPATPFIDWGLLGHIILVSFVAGVGIVVAFSLGLVATSIWRDHARSGFARALGSIVAVVMGLAILGVLLWGFKIIVTKS